MTLQTTQRLYYQTIDGAPPHTAWATWTCVVCGTLLPPPSLQLSSDPCLSLEEWRLYQSPMLRHHAIYHSIYWTWREGVNGTDNSRPQRGPSCRCSLSISFPVSIVSPINANASRPGHANQVMTRCQIASVRHHRDPSETVDGVSNPASLAFQRHIATLRYTGLLAWLSSEFVVMRSTKAMR